MKERNKIKYKNERNKKHKNRGIFIDSGKKLLHG